MSLPQISPASSLNVFKFYDNRAIHRAILHKGTLMKVAKAFSLDQREEAFKFACGLSKNYSTLLSPDFAIYRVWVDIRYQSNPESACPAAPQVALCA